MGAKEFQTLVDQIKSVIDLEFGILDYTGNVIECTNPEELGNKVNIQRVLDSEENVVSLKGATYQKVYVKGKPEFITFISGIDANSKKFLSLISIAIENIKLYSTDKPDKLSFIKSIITENILPWDIQIRARELEIEDIDRVVLVVNSKDKSKTLQLIETMQRLFEGSDKDFVMLLDEENVVLVKQITKQQEGQEINSIANRILEVFSNHNQPLNVSIGIGTTFDTINNISRSFKEAQMALLIGGIFENEKSIISYNNLGIGRLIYQLPITLCKLFLQEVFKEGSLESLDEETLLTIQKFFENSLNVSETSRQLYIHRNTLVYRLDKIQKITGMDLRQFDDAITFKVAMLVRKYLEKNQDT